MAARRSAPVTGTPFFGREAIELAAVDEDAAFVVEEEVRGAGGLIGAGDILRFVVASKGSELELAGLLAHAVRVHPRELRDVVG